MPRKGNSEQTPFKLEGTVVGTFFTLSRRFSHIFLSETASI